MPYIRTKPHYEGHTLFSIKNGQIAFFMAMLFVSVLLGEVPQQTMPNDLEIVQAAERRISDDPSISSRLIDIECSSGNVTLSGMVSDLLDLDRVVLVMQSIRGVRSIIDRLTVNPVYRSDRDIQKDMDAALKADAIASLYKIGIMVDHGTAVLVGTVPSLEEKIFIGDIARRVKGLMKIDNRIEVKLTENPAPGDIEKEIKEILAWDPYLNSDLISVSMLGSVVILKGMVGSLSEKAFAHNDAILPGVTEIDDSLLRVEPWDRHLMRKSSPVTIRSDDGITQSMRQVMAGDPRIARFRIDPLVHNGVVTLRGKVSTLRDVQIIRRDAAHVGGVGRVIAMVRVRPGKQIDDSTLEVRARQAIQRDPTLEKKTITPVARNGILFLYGTTDNFFERNYCADILSSITGVVDIKNLLDVKARPFQWKNDDQLRFDILFEYQWNALLRDDSLAVRVDNGIASLSGRVRTRAEMALVVETAFRIGAREVRVDIGRDGMREYGIFHSGDVYSYSSF
jgi:osmotically-inducible protein OsmY